MTSATRPVTPFPANSLCLPPLLLLLSPLLVWKAQAFLPAPLTCRIPVSRTIGTCSRTAGAKTIPRHCAIPQGNTEVVSVAAEVWEGFGEEDHDRFLAEFWQKKPLLIRQAVKG